MFDILRGATKTILAMRADPVFQRKLVKDRVFQKLGECLARMDEVKKSGLRVDVVEGVQEDILCCFAELTSNPKYAKKANLLSQETHLSQQIQTCLNNSSGNPIIAQAGISVIK